MTRARIEVRRQALVRLAQTLSLFGAPDRSPVLVLAECGARPSSGGRPLVTVSAPSERRAERRGFLPLREIELVVTVRDTGRRQDDPTGDALCAEVERLLLADFEWSDPVLSICLKECRLQPYGNTSASLRVHRMVFDTLCWF